MRAPKASESLHKEFKVEGLWELKLGIRQPAFYKASKTYVGGLDCGLFLYPQTLDQEQRTSEKALISIEAGISGVFTVMDERFEEPLEQQLVRVQIPALLFPYLRGTITLLLANAGFGSVIMPLINVNELAKETLKDKEILVVE